MRIAWIGPAPAVAGGVGYMATTLLRALPSAGVEVDCYVAGDRAALPTELFDVDGLTIETVDVGWRYGRWYSSNDLTKIASGLGARAAVQDRLIARVAQRHQTRPYAALYQFSQLELLSIRRHRRHLPPVIVHPETHAAGELKWHRLERQMALRCETPRRHYAARAMLATRAAIQARDARGADRLVCPSAVFARALIDDYRVDRARCCVVANPIDTARFSPWPDRARASGRPIVITFISRMAVRKGVEMVVDLSHRLIDLEGSVQMRVVGDRSLWSDYRCLLEGLEPRIARYEGDLPSIDAPSVYRESDILLQPSHYEPFALTVGEALASGVPVVVSDAVGAGEGIDSACCRRFPVGSRDGMEAALRGLVAELQGDARPRLAGVARAEAERAFRPQIVATAIRDVIADVGEATK